MEMPEWYIRILLSVLFSSVSFGDNPQHDTINLMECEGKTVNFSYPFELKEYRRVKWTFSAHSTTTDIAKSKDFARGPIEYLADGYKGRLEVFPDSTIKFSLNQISRKDSGTFSFLIIYANGDQDIFKWNLKVEAVTNITMPSVTTNIGNECTEYICSTEQKDVHRSWIYQGDKQMNGSTLRLCNNNRSLAVSCIVKDACSSNYTTVIEALDYDDSCLGCYICIGICLVISTLIVILIVLMWKKREQILNLRKQNRLQQKADKAYEEREAKTEPYHKDYGYHCMEKLKTSS